MVIGNEKVMFACSKDYLDSLKIFGLMKLLQISISPMLVYSKLFTSSFQNIDYPAKVLLYYPLSLIDSSLLLILPSFSQ